jgi:hypothetical protein
MKYWFDKTKEDEMGRACSTHVEHETCVHCEGKRPLGRPKLQLAYDISPLKLMFVYIIFKNSAHTSKRTQHLRK